MLISFFVSFRSISESCNFMIEADSQNSYSLEGNHVYHVVLEKSGFGEIFTQMRCEQGFSKKFRISDKWLSSGKEWLNLEIVQSPPFGVLGSQSANKYVVASIKILLIAYLINMGILIYQLFYSFLVFRKKKSFK
jgi:hypothetical protein